MDNVVMPTPRVLALRAARAAPPKRRPRASRCGRTREGMRWLALELGLANWLSGFDARNAGVHCMERLGYRVLRLPAHLVLEYPAAALEQIRTALGE